MTHIRTYGLTFILSTCFIVVLFFMALQNTLPRNPLDGTKSLSLLKIFPQGWGFFSKSPRDDVTIILDPSLNLAANWPNNSIKNLFGINRFGRTQGIEMGLIYSKIPEKSWTKCDEAISNCINNTSEIVQVSNTTPNPSFCGNYILVTREVVPWAWSKLITPIEMPSKFVKVESRCIKK